MKLNLIIVGGLIVASAVAYYGMQWMEKHKYDPIVLENGYTEYRLISPDRTRKNTAPNIINLSTDGLVIQPSTKKSSTTDAFDQHWVLQFPKELRVFRPEVEQTLAIYRQKHRVPFSSPNYMFRLYFAFPDFAMQNKMMSYSRKDMLLVTLFATDKIYEPKEQTRRYNTSFTRQKDPRFNPRCTKDKEIIPGLFQLKSRTEEERKRVREKYGPTPGNCVSISNDTSGPLYYSVYDTLGQIQGAGSCDQSIAQRCKFEFWLPQKRVVEYTFYSQNLSKIHEIHATVVDLLTKATDRNKSINMFDKGE